MIVLIALCFCMTSMFIYAEKQQKYVPAVILKGLASLSFVILGFMNSSGTAAASKIVTGLVLGCIADVLLNLRYVAKEKGKPVFLAGILVFLSGHILYLLAVFPMNTGKIFCIILSVILTALLMKWIFTKITAEKAFKIGSSLISVG